MLELKKPVTQLVQVKLVLLTQTETDPFIPADKRVQYLTFYLTLTKVLIKFYICLFDFWHKRIFSQYLLCLRIKKKKKKLQSVTIPE